MSIGRPIRGEYPGAAEKMAPKWSKSVWVITCLLLFVLSVRVITAVFLQQPGYMDAYYYSNLAENLYRGHGFVDYVIWNFLGMPLVIPQPACLYWMPLTACVVVPFYHVFGASFSVAQIPFILLSTALAWIAYRVSIEISGQRDQALLAGILIGLSGFYTVFWVTTDSFAPFAVVAGLSVYAAGRGLKSGRRGWFALSGGLAGLAHLTRADGILVFVAVVLAVLVWGCTSQRRDRLIVALSLTMVAYTLVMSPWFVRNWQVTGNPLGQGGLQTLFLRDYDELYSYGRELTLSHYLSWGWRAILSSKLDAVWFGIQNLVVVNLMIFLAPLAAWGPMDLAETN